MRGKTQNYNGKIQKGPDKKRKYNSALLQDNHAGDEDAVGGAPLLELHKPWIWSLPKPAGSRRSPIPKNLRRMSPSSSRRCASAPSSRSRSRSAVPRNLVRGKPSLAAPLSCGLDGGGGSTPELLRATPPRGRTTTCKSFTGRASSAMTPPAATQLTPTLPIYTDPSIPRPPATGAAAGGRGIKRIDGEGGGASCRSKSRPSLLGRGRVTLQGAVLLFIVLPFPSLKNPSK